MIIAIDGYSSTGKSTLAKMLAEKIGCRHLNSGLIYRAISYNLLLNGINKSNYEHSIEKTKEITETFIIDLDQIQKIISEIKSKEVTEFGTKIAKLQFVRDRVTEVMHEASTNSDIIVEGRDIGTVLFPNAEIKFFFKADSAIRAVRLGAERNSNDFEALKVEIETRDREDETREISPLKRAKDAIDIDTGQISVPETLELLEYYINEFKK